MSKSGYPEKAPVAGRSLAKVSVIYDKHCNRVCPSCCHMVSQLEVELSRFDYECPQCGKFKLSEFERLDNASTKR